MTRLFKATAIAALTLTTAMPAFARADMTCGEYNDLSAAEQMVVAKMAVAEITGTTDGTLADNNGTATATNASEGEKAEESVSGSVQTLANNNGTATATTTVPAGNDESMMQEKIDLLNLTCAQNMDAMVYEAASGQTGNR